MKKPDLIFISEANLEEQTQEYETLITGYSIQKQKPSLVNTISRLVLLIKDGTYIKIEHGKMDQAISSIWTSISRRGMKKIMICGIYREHRYVDQTDDLSSQPAAQNQRWEKFLKQIEDVGANVDIYIVGDFNLDYQKWQMPDPSHAQMIQCTKNSLETNGYTQLVKGITRSWPGQTDSSIDHFWTNVHQKVICCRNEVQAVGDHNLITAEIRIQGKDACRLDIRRRSFKNFDPKVYREKLEVNWSEIYKLQDVDSANYFLENNLNTILDKICPFKTIQHRNNQKPWISVETKESMMNRDRVREIGRNSQDPANWKKYHQLRNSVNSMIEIDRKNTTMKYTQNNWKQMTLEVPTRLQRFKLGGEPPPHQ